MELVHAIDRCLAGDPSAYEVVVRAHADALTGLLRRLVGNAEDARELTQETFVRAFRNLHRFDRRRPLKPWLFRIGRNLAYNFLDARKRAPGLAGSDDAQADLINVPDAEPSPASSVAAKEQRHAVDEVLRTLRPEFREVLVYRYLERMDHDEIAEVMGVPVGTVKTWLHRAKAQFRKHSEGRELF